MAARWNINHKIAVIKAIKAFVTVNQVELPLAYKELEEAFVVCQRALKYDKRNLYRETTGALIKQMIDEIYPRTTDEVLFCLVDKGIKKHRELNNWSHLTVDADMKLVPPVIEFIIEDAEPTLTPDVPVVAKGYNKKAKSSVPVYRKEDMKLVVVIGLREQDKAGLLKYYNGKPVELHCVQSDSPNKLKQACAKANVDMFIMFTNFMHHSSYELVKKATKQVPKDKMERVNGGFSSLYPVIDKLIMGE